MNELAASFSLMAQADSLHRLIASSGEPLASLIQATRILLLNLI